MENTLDNLKVHGDGSFAGGHYNTIKIHGSAIITENTNANTMSITGSCIAKGDVHCETLLDIHGHCDILGDVTSNFMKLNGACEIGGNTVININKNRGHLEISNNFSGDKLSNKGDLYVKENVNFETFISDGRFRIGGLLNAGEINISPSFSTSTVKEIGGEKITIKLKTGLRFVPFSNKGRVETELIEGDTIYLENTHANIVRGQNIEIGAGCVIDVVEYSGKCIVSPDATVLERIMV